LHFRQILQQGSAGSVPDYFLHGAAKININKIGIQTEKEKSAGMDKSVKFYKEMYRRRKKK